MIDEDGRILDWARIQQIFHGALERDGEERTRYLDRACDGDPSLRTEVESLLAHATEGLLGEPADGPPEPESAETGFGEYRILRLLGQGGMGSVYLAERVKEGFTQRVALKLLRRDLFHPVGGSPELERRFARERQILARLEHPGIARLIDGGYGPGGQPYLAMEYVEGEPLTQFVLHRDLPVEGRLELFIAVCEAVHYAHQRLVIHRDLKPSNIVITESGDPKLLDFGVATLVETDAEPLPRVVTEARTGAWFTPSYASPEQVRGERVTTLSDLYSLGVLLYELVTGVRPYEITDLSPAGVEYVVCGRVPERPSTRVGSGTLARRLRGDLDTIILKALAKEPERRYRSAQDLAEDLRRHLNHEPVSARPDSLGYRARTFARRHRAAVTGAAIALVALTGGLITTSWQARAAAAARERAEAALARSEEVTDFLIELFQQADPTVSQVDVAFSRAVLDRGAARVDELEDQPEIQARLLDVLGQVSMNLRLVENARTMTERALEVRRRVLGEDHLDVAVSLQHLGQVRRVEGRYTEAEPLYRQSLAIIERKTGRDDPAYASVLSDLAFLLPYLSRTAEAESIYRQVVDIRRRTLPPTDPAIGDAVLRVAATLSAQRKFAAAESSAREGLALRQQSLGALHPLVGYALINLADIVARDSSRWAEAESLYRGGLSLQERAHGPDHIVLVHGIGNLGQLLGRMRRYAEAESLLRRNIRIREETLGRDHIATSWDWGALADLWARQGRLDEAIAIRTEAVLRTERTYGPEHSDVGGALSGLAQLYLEQGDLVAAETLLVRSVAIRERAHGPNNLLAARGLATLGEISLKRRNYTLAVERLTQALAKYQAGGLASDDELALARRNLAAAYRALGRPADAARYAVADSS